MKLRKGVFLTFEGIEGAGKSTQIDLLGEYLSTAGTDYLRTVEPGGTLIGDEIRKILLSVENQGMTPLCELLLYAASRAQHVGEIIRPGLERGTVVICDRFADSTLAYQGFGRGIDRDLIMKLNGLCTEGVAPDLTILLDVDVETGLRRNREASKVDRLELETIAFHRRVREGYLSIARQDPQRIRVLDASGDPAALHRVVRDIVRGFLEERVHAAR